MKIDHDFALIELDEEESRWFSQERSKFREKVIKQAERLSDKVQRTVEIYSHEGTVLETVTNY